MTPENLAALGADRLAVILTELAEDDAAIKRRLRLELAAQDGGDRIAAEIGRRITSLRSARSFVDWQKRRDFTRDLDLQRAMITDRVAPARPDLALDLMWRFLDLAEPVINRVDDSTGAVGDVFRAACEDLGTIAVQARPEPVALADRVQAALLANDYGVLDDFVRVMIPALGKAGMARLGSRLTPMLTTRADAGGWDGRAHAARRALQDIADGQQDVDAYIALVPAPVRSTPHACVEIGCRLLVAGRANEALAALERARPERSRRIREDDEPPLAGSGADSAWEEVYITALDATGQQEQAQRLRWAAFERCLSLVHLRAYLERLPDFDDLEAEDRAMQYALGFASFPAALSFFQQWPSRDFAARLVMTRTREIDENLYFLLDPAAQLVEDKHPVAATLLRRASPVPISSTCASPGSPGWGGGKMQQSRRRPPGPPPQPSLPAIRRAIIGRLLAPLMPRIQCPHCRKRFQLPPNLKVPR